MARVFFYLPPEVREVISKYYLRMRQKDSPEIVPIERRQRNWALILTSTEENELLLAGNILSLSSRQLIYEEVTAVRYQNLTLYFDGTNECSSLEQHLIIDLASYSKFCHRYHRHLQNNRDTDLQ